MIRTITKTLAAFSFLTVRGLSVTPPGCKVLPVDANWPSIDEWNRLNASLEGNLIRTAPIGSPCHNPTFDQVQCDVVRNNWNRTLFHEESATSIISEGMFTNQSCSPFTPPDAQCIIGVYPQYSVNVSTPAHVITAVRFVKQHNVRFVVKNTGHDVMGKVLGAGSLSIWMHNLQNRTWIDNFSSSRYIGPAVQVQAGVLSDTLYQDAHQRGHIVIGGSFPTVGIAGGHLQGGGHSVLTNVYGLAADNALSYEVITPTGRFIRTSPTENEDLFWALSGGGGTTYGIVWSVTVKVFPDVPVVVGRLNFASFGISEDLYWDSISVFQDHTPVFTDGNSYAAAFYDKSTFTLSMFAVNNSRSGFLQLVKPITSRLNVIGISFNLSVSPFTDLRSAFLNLFGDTQSRDIYASNSIGVTTTRLLPRLQSTEIALKIKQLTRKLANAGGSVVDLPLRPTLKIAGNPENAVLPAWRNSERHFILTKVLDDSATGDEINTAQMQFRNDFGEPLKRLTPGAGAYLNEADPSDPNWKNDFYGVNYQRLLQIKDKWDPDGILFGSTAVGGDRWVEQKDGRLCRIIG
ncbi:FAD binding domain protein [Crucibulum laeve]|uniref:FAD binding domain protein n=1 Tax=Crucibulum laeve TaxID=68775 RepID=A0A5C3LIJ0_9AGAR|nr:FAD binding domain protein [Crucibulum laeve]